MLTYVFEHNNVPLYEQVYQCMKHDIIEGVLQPGEKLPSKRTFATHNGISTITIQNAYDQLISEGYIYTIPKKGTASLAFVKWLLSSGALRIWFA